MNHQQQPTVLDPYAAQYPAQSPYPAPYAAQAQHPAFGPPATYAPPPAGFGAPVPPARPRKRRGGLIAGLVGGGAVVLGGLGVGAFLLLGPQSLVTDEVESEIVRITQEQVAVAATGVVCPDDIPVAAGSAVTCTGTVEGQTVTFTVTQDDDQGNLTITHDRLLAVAEVEGAVSEQLTAEIGEDVVAVCSAEGQTVLVNAPGTAIPCTAVNAYDTSLSAEITVTVDEAGSVAYEFV